MGGDNYSRRRWIFSVDGLFSLKIFLYRGVKVILLVKFGCFRVSLENLFLSKFFFFRFLY